jgi:hypothetical protein
MMHAACCICRGYGLVYKPFMVVLHCVHTGGRSAVEDAARILLDPNARGHPDLRMRSDALMHTMVMKSNNDNKY